MRLKKSNFYINILELKYRLFYYLFSVVITFIICFEYKIELFFYVSETFLTIKKYFIYTSLLDPVFIYLKLTFLFAFLFSLPLFIYLLFFFIIKGFRTLYITLYCLFLFVISITSTFFYYFFSKYIIPFIFNFLLSFQRTEVDGSIFELYLEATIAQYYTFIYNLIVVYILLLLVPSVLYLLFLSNIYSYSLEFSTRKYIYIFLIFIFLLLAPPDFILQIFILPFFLFLIEFYIYILIYFSNLYNILSNN